MNKIISFFTTNIVWKVTALVMAVILWILAVNIEDPLETEYFRTIPIQIENMDVLDRYGLVLLNQDEIEKTNVTVRVQANRNLLTTLSKNNIKAYIDMSPISFTFMDMVGESLSAPVYVTLPDAASSARDKSPTPNSVKIVLDRLETREFPVTVVKTSEAADGYVSMEPVVSPETVRLKGARSILDVVQSVRVEVGLDAAKADYTVYAAPIVLGEDNEDLTSKVTIDTNEVEVFIPINRHSQIPLVTPVINGFTAEGYTITNVEMDVEYIDVVGRDEELAALTSIRLDPIDVSGLSETKVSTRDVRDFLRTTNLSVRNGKPHEVNITVTIEREEIREFIIPISNVEIIGDHPGAQFAESVTVRVRGVERIISGLANNAIGASINISELAPGEHDVPVALSLPEGVSRIGEEPVIHVTIPEEGEGEPTETPPAESATPTESIPPAATDDPTETDEPSETDAPPGEVEGLDGTDVFDEPSESPPSTS